MDSHNNHTIHHSVPYSSQKSGPHTSAVQDLLRAACN